MQKYHEELIKTFYAILFLNSDAFLKWYKLYSIFGAAQRQGEILKVHENVF